MKINDRQAQAHTGESNLAHHHQLSPPPVTECVNPVSQWHVQGGESVVFIESLSIIGYLSAIIASWMPLAVIFQSAFTAALRWYPVIHRERNAGYTDCAKTPESQHLIGSLKFAIRALCTEFVALWTWLLYALWHLSSQGTAKTIMIRHCVGVDCMTTSGLRLMCDVWKLQVLVQVSLECPVDWLLYDTMVLNVDAWHLRGAVFAKRWRWCLCLTLGVSSSGHVLVYGRALVRLYHSAIFLYYGQLCTMTECELDSIGKDVLEQNKSGWDGLSKGLSQTVLQHVFGHCVLFEDVCLIYKFT